LYPGAWLDIYSVLSILLVWPSAAFSLLKLIPKGKVTTYKELARALGTKAWRAVGSAMAKNTRLLAIPCHRVVRSDGSVGQYAQGSARKSRILVQEGVVVTDGKVKDLDRFMHRFTG
jgi:methylated-DNA-[protein]-cysteine S-methyltransferase